MSIRRTLLTAFVSVLNGPTKPSDVPEARARRSLPDSAITENEVNVYFAVEDVNVKGGRFGPLVTRDVRIVVECRGVTTDADEIDTMMDPMMDWVAKSIMGSNNLNRLAINIDEIGTTWTPFFLDKYFPITRTSFVVSFQTGRGDPNSPS